MTKPGANSKVGITEFQFPQPKEKQKLSQIIYNSKEGTFFGRTGKNWGQLLLFYAIFYIVLAALFAICMQGLLSTLNDKVPKWQLDSSLIGTNPGMGFRPLSEQTERGSIIQFDEKKPAEGQYWIDLLNEFLSDYQHTVGTKVKHCSFNHTHQADEVCIVSTDDFGPCSPENNFGYKNRRPCIFLKLNKIFGWQPLYYDNPNDYPDGMPADLRKTISESSHLERQKIWVSCHGHYAADKEVFKGIKFYPSAGFPAYYYPFRNQKGYMSPLVAVQFENPPPNKMLNVECRAWAKNIIYSGSNRDRMGSVTFQILVD